MSTPVDEIKSRLDLVELIQSYVRLQKAGINYRANCPFHTEKTPSFFVSPTRQIWHCFGCGKGGDHFKFIMEIEGHDFPEALRLLASRAGVVIRREDPTIRSERNRLYDLCEEAAKIFERNLSLTPAAKSYLKKRGVKDETIQEFRIGFAPQSWDFLIKSLAQRGFRKEEMDKAGLAVKSEDGTSWYDRFRSRIMFPISDASGRTVGFSGRIFGQPTTNNQQPTTEAKYVNTPNTLIYDKSKILYGFDKVKQDIRTKNQVVVVEGQMDFLMSHQAGVKNVIAVSGTALTPHQLKTLRRLCDTMVSSFDTDTAGDEATRRSLALASQFEFEREIAVITSGKDPADMVLENPQLWREAVEQAKPVVEFYFEKTFREKDSSTAQGKKEISSILIPLIAELTNEVEKAHFVGEVARRLGVSEDAIWKEMRRRGANEKEVGAGENVINSTAQEIVGRRDLLEERLLSLLTMIKGEIKARELADHRLQFVSTARQELFNFLCGPAVTVAATPELQGQLELLRFKGEVLAQMTQDLEGEFTACWRELEKECVKERLLKLGEEIERREKEGEQAVVVSLLKDFRTLSDRLKTLSQ